ncbi:ABC transporter substrate-binding protein [Corynebacterium sp. UBA2622]|uniref:ABC transporter substrate-binding protein n=1 Tax=Corynebacterium sp. UBA2622 TaxID=1946393 RepID=UPI0025C4840D|nr:ABC transporter substrate-binding protein [Corynebacterium sp. UBA2622]
MNISFRRPGRGAAAVLTAAALALTGCSRASDSGDAAGKTSESGAAAAEANNERVAALGLGDVDTALALGVVPTVVAPFGGEGDVGPKGVGPWAEERFGDKQPVVIYGTGSGFTSEAMEKVIGADPTNIIAVNTVLEQDTLSQLRNIAPVTVKPDGAKDWQIPWEDQVRAIAGGLGKKDEGDTLVKDTEKKFEDFRSAHGDLQGKKGAVAMPFNGQISIYGSGDGRGQFVEDMGMTIPQDLQSTDTFYNALSAENFGRLDELDRLFIVDWGGAAEQLRNDPNFQNLKIVREGRVVFLDQNTGSAMSMPNPLTIPWALNEVSKNL